MGHVDSKELVKVYQKALIFAFPSHYEGFPTVVLEAMSSALPVLLSDIPAHKSIIQDGKDGMFFKKGDYSDMAEKLRIMLDNEDLRIR
jgi:glycosyltransferase involved in cell wall biosynthesis